MAALFALVFLLGVSTVNAATLVDKQASSVIRRENQAMHLDSAGKLQPLMETEPEDQSSALTYCNRQFLIMADGTNDCTPEAHQSEQINIQSDCQHAAQMLDKTVAADFVQNTHTGGTLPYPKGCFINATDGKVYFNPTVPEPTTYSGQKICMRSLYVEHNKTAGAGCTGGATLVTDFEACHVAATCVAGGGAPKLIDFASNWTTTAEGRLEGVDKPEGCFQNDLGEWGFNHIEPTGTVVGGTSVCLNAGGAHTPATTAVTTDTTAVTAAP